MMRNITFDCVVVTQRWDVSTSHTSLHIILWYAWRNVLRYYKIQTPYKRRNAI